jgi:hypothetical protein
MYLNLEITYVASSLSFPFKASGSDVFHCFKLLGFVSSFIFIFFWSFRKSQPLSRPVLIRAKESKTSITNEDEERVTREGQLESPDRGVGVFLFLGVLSLRGAVRCRAGRGFGVEKIPNSHPAQPHTVWQKSKPCPQIST